MLENTEKIYYISEQLKQRQKKTLTYTFHYWRLLS